MLCRHYIVEGRVQGVFFRVSTRDRAQDIGLRGWVRNLPDGRVEAVACGDEAQLDSFELWLKQGPDMALVSEVKIESWTQTTDFSGFDVR